MREGSHGAFFRGLGASMVGASPSCRLQIPGMDTSKALVSLEVKLSRPSSCSPKTHATRTMSRVQGLHIALGMAS